MIKFRCRRCAQKIAVNNEGAGADIPCTNCDVRLVVPFESDCEFLSLNSPDVLIEFPASTKLSKFSDSDLGDKSRKPYQEVTETRDDFVRSGVISQVAHLMMDKLFRATLSQRQQLIESQKKATERVLQMEARVEKVHQQFHWRLQAEKRRIAELELELASRDDKIDELTGINKALAKHVEKPKANQSDNQRDLADTTLLLRA